MATGRRVTRTLTRRGDTWWSDDGQRPVNATGPLGSPPLTFATSENWAGDNVLGYGDVSFIAREYGVSPRTIKLILTEASWKGV